MKTIITGVRAHFHERRAEWALAAIMVSFGLILLTNPHIFIKSTAYIGMSRLASQHTWGLVTLAVGATRMVALAVDGSMKDFAWAPHLRALTSFVSCFIWFQIIVGFFVIVPAYTTGLATYPVFLLLDIYQTYVAAQEIAWCDKKRERKNGRHIL